MNKNEIFSQVTFIEEQIGELYKQLGQLKEKIVVLIEENHNLTIENERLRHRLENNIEPAEAESGSIASKENAAISEGYDNLARLYHEGFHVCNLHYGSLRTDGDCLFCLSFLNK